jgi:hypothetical protein
MIHFILFIARCFSLWKGKFGRTGRTNCTHLFRKGPTSKGDPIRDQNKGLRLYTILD